MPVVHTSQLYSDSKALSGGVSQGATQRCARRGPAKCTTCTALCLWPARYQASVLALASGSASKLLLCPATDHTSSFNVAALLAVMSTDTPAEAVRMLGLSATPCAAVEMTERCKSPREWKSWSCTACLKTSQRRLPSARLHRAADGTARSGTGASRSSESMLYCILRDHWASPPLGVGEGYDSCRHVGC